MVSLQEQFLKAGLVNKNKAKRVSHEKTNQKKADRQTGKASVDETRLAALAAQQKSAERTRELNAQRVAAANEKAIMAQITQMVQQSRQPKGRGDIAYNFTYGTKVERMYVSAEIREQLIAGRLVIVRLGDATELVPSIVADKIAERDPSLIVRVNKPSTKLDEDDPYAEYKIPDDLMW